ncbi:hypothetical protein HA402_009489 [Bradysia odoriphaga]|nr:hypothetical protein HA402_009489 [Bradysia odoriphaga]
MRLIKLIFRVIFIVRCKRRTSCLMLQISHSARLPRKADTNGSSSSSEKGLSIPEMFIVLIDRISTEKNITLTEAQKSGASEIFNKDWTKSAFDKNYLTLEDIEKFKTELATIIPSEVAEEASSLLSKITKDASPDDAAEGLVRVLTVLYEETVKRFDDAKH